MKSISLKQRTVISLSVVGAGILVLASTILYLQLNSHSTFDLNKEQLSLLEASGETLDALTQLTIPVAAALESGNVESQHELYIQSLKRYNDQKIKLRELALSELWSRKFMDLIDQGDADVQGLAREILAFKQSSASSSPSREWTRALPAASAGVTDKTAERKLGQQFSKFQQASTQVESVYRDFERAARRKIAAQTDEDAATMFRVAVISAITVALVLLLCGVTAVVLVRSVYRPLMFVSDSVMSIEGDLTRRLPAGGEHEISQLSKWLNAFLERLDRVVAQMKATSMEVAAAASQLSEGNQSFAQRLSEQAAAVEEIAATMAEMTSTVSQNVTNAQQSNAFASQNRQSAVEGGKALSDLIESVSGMGESAKKISEIIGVIEEISFQTNLLALNAAIEAARAGEQGRGFAVVASEVRNLAARSSSAAREISALISENVAQTKRGMELAKVSGRSMDKIIASAKSVADLVSEIAAASQEQADGIQQVNSAIAQMDRVTQQNAAMIEQSSALSEELAAQSREMAKRIDFFKTTAHGSSPAPQPAVRDRRVAHLRPHAAPASAPRLAGPARVENVSPRPGAATPSEEELIRAAQPQFGVQPAPLAQSDSFGGFEEF